VSLNHGGGELGYDSFVHVPPLILLPQNRLNLIHKHYAGGVPLSRQQQPSDLQTIERRDEKNQPKMIQNHVF